MPRAAVTAFLALLALTMTPALAADKHKHNVDSGNLALKGYDPVSYHTQDKPAKGKGDITLEYAGDVFRFADEDSREKFKADPARYAPAYGGWCAYALADDGSLVDIDPTNYKIVDGRLMLFYKGWYGDALKKWNQKDEQTQVEAADKAWKKGSGE